MAVSIASPSVAEKSPQDPFLVPRPDFYDSSTRTDTPSAPNLFRLIGRDFKNLVTTKENLVILGAGLGASWGASHYDGVVGSALSSELNGGTSLDRVFESGEFAGVGYVQVGAALGAYGLGKVFRSRGVEELGRDLLRADVARSVGALL